MGLAGALGKMSLYTNSLVSMQAQPYAQGLPAQMAIVSHPYPKTNKTKLIIFCLHVQPGLHPHLRMVGEPSFCCVLYQ